MAQRIVFFSGMGADQGAFQFLDLGEVEKVFVNWQEPKPEENLHAYALRLIANVPIYPTDILIGLSMGGMIAQEIASVKPVKCVILVSSLRSGETLRPLFTAAQKLALLKLVNEDLLKKTIVNGAKILLPHSKERIRIIVAMLDQFSGAYYKWAMQSVLAWQGANTTCPVYHVHGDKDEIFPVSLVKDAVIIKGGTHLMITMRAEEVSKVLRDFLARA